MDFSFDEKLKLASEMCDHNYQNAFKFSTIYPFTTENISAYLPLFDLDGKSLLTVGSSCDQALNAFLYGANEVTIFDICPFTYEYYCLKKAAIETLTLEEFICFFCYKSYSKFLRNNFASFDRQVYLRLRDALGSYSDESMHFWDALFSKYDSMTIRDQLFSTDEEKHQILRIINNYLNDKDNYFALRKIIGSAKINFVTGDILTVEFTNSYDNIFLSNLACYHKFDVDKELFAKMIASLNDEGKILLTYLYEITPYACDYMEGEPEIYNIDKVKSELPYEIKFNSFIGVHGLLWRTDRIKDTVVTYKKVKKI